VFINIVLLIRCSITFSLIFPPLCSFIFIFLRFAIKREEKLVKLERHQFFLCIVIIRFLNVLIDRIIYLPTAKSTIVTLHYECYNDMWVVNMNATMTCEWSIWMLRWHMIVQYECCDVMLVVNMNATMTCDCSIWMLWWHVIGQYKCYDDMLVVNMNVTMTWDCSIWMLRLRVIG
jgi:hypothetical protein